MSLEKEDRRDGEGGGMGESHKWTRMVLKGQNIEHEMQWPVLNLEFLFLFTPILNFLIHLYIKL